MPNGATLRFESNRTLGKVTKKFKIHHARSLTNDALLVLQLRVAGMNPMAL